MSHPRFEAVVIGASAGALEALSAILPGLPSQYRLPLLIVIHVPPDKRSVLVELFRAKCSIQVQEAEDKEPMRNGTAYFAPSDYHLLLEKDKTLSLSSDEPVLYSRPSIDVLFESAADALGPQLIGIVLTGANHDGANGIRAVVRAGGIALVQKPEGAYAPEMPTAAIGACPDAQVMTLDEIKAFLQEV